VQLLDDGPAHRGGVLALDDDRAGAVAVVLAHEDVPPRIGGVRGQADLRVALLAEHVRHHLLEGVARETVEDGHGLRSAWPVLAASVKREDR
jgi:hypothetical protein